MAKARNGRLLTARLGSGCSAELGGRQGDPEGDPLRLDGDLPLLRHPLHLQRVRPPSPPLPPPSRRCAAAAEAERASNANRKPWLPLAFGLLFQPMYHTLIKDNLFGDVHIKNYMKSMALVTTIVAVVSAIVWLSYSQHHNFWCAKSLLLTPGSSTSERVVRGAWGAGGARSRGWSTSSA